MNDIAQFNLKEAPQVDWDNYGKSGFQLPPDALDLAGKPIIYYGVVGKATEDKPDEDYLNYVLDPITIIGDGPENGYVLRFTRASLRPYTFTDKDGNKVAKKGNPSKLADYLRACGGQVKPLTNDQFRAAVQQTVTLKKKFAFTLDWEAYNKDNQETIKGYNAFPIDPTSGKRKAILKAGEFYNIIGPDYKPTGELKKVESDVLFANARLRFFRDPKGSVKA